MLLSKVRTASSQTPFFLVAGAFAIRPALPGRRIEAQWAPPWRRESFPQIIDQASNDRTRPIRVEVREADGSVFTDLITARPRRALPEPEPTVEAKPTPALPVFHQVEGDGFVPGEDVAVAIITGHTDAAHTGTARALIDPTNPIPEQTTAHVEVLLLGRISGATVIRRGLKISWALKTSGSPLPPPAIRM